MGLSVAVADVLEAEGAVIAYKPTSKTKEQFRKRRMHVEVVLSLNVVGGELAEVNLVEPNDTSVGKHYTRRVAWMFLHDLVGEVDFVEAQRERESGQRHNDRDIRLVCFKDPLRITAIVLTSEVCVSG